ncbi:MAG: hypothetical protein Q4D51_01560 [Eubacteriales bacterium]|nr:hypothetical protein [Eubacteriales bacterium]
MIIKCPNCDGALEYDVHSKQMLCKFCYSYFDENQFGTQPEEDMRDTISKQEMDNPSDTMEQLQMGLSSEDADDEYMESDMYTCTACGAELMINNVESSTFCAYCGQPTIVFSRVSKCRRPKYIIPFSVTKEQALKKIRDTLNKGFFVPQEIKDFKVEMLRGIYVPFWLYDIDYKDRLVVRGTVGSGKNSRTRYFYRKASCAFERITIDASKRFNDESSQRLEPYRVQEAIPFQEGYLSGFYADCSDDDKIKMRNMALGRAKILFDAEVLKSISASNKNIIRSNPQYKMVETSYALLPAWFLVFRAENEHYTIMVNGQTGKLVGAVPSDKKKEMTVFGVMAVIFAILFGIVGMTLFSTGIDSEATGKLIAFIAVIIGTMWLMARGNYKRYKMSKTLTTENAIKNLVTERQDDH